jgi:hypothetical protein
MTIINRTKLSKAQCAELELVRKKHRGRLKPEDVVDFARNPKTQLHKCFEWDDTEAAQRFRLMQAREVIRVAVVVLPNTNAPVRAYVSLQRDRKTGRGYRATAQVLSDGQLREELVAEALADMEMFKLRYHVLKELARVFDAMDKAVKTLAPVKRKRKTG